MRFIFADPALRNNGGHYATHCRSIAGELRRRGIASIVLAHKEVDQELRAELAAQPFFDVSSNWFSDGDPISGHLNAFHISAEATYKNLTRLSDIGVSDLIYFSSVRPAQLYAIVLWMSGIPPDRLPRAVAGFANDPGLDLSPDKSSYVMRDPRIDPNAMLYRFALSRMPQHVAERLNLVSFEAVISEVYSALLQYSVGVLPMLRVATGPLRKRGQNFPVTLSALGVQRPNKGYHLMPDVIRGVLQLHPNIRFLVHNSAPSYMPAQQGIIRALAQNDSRIVVDERLLMPGDWAKLIQMSDLIVCPYHPATFYACASGVAMEAVANAVPFVGPAETTLHRLMHQLGCGTAFEKFEASAIVAAIDLALRNFDHVATKALIGAEHYASNHGPAPTVDAMLRYAQVS